MPDTLVTLSSVARFVKETNVFNTAGHLNTRGWLDVELGSACLGLCRLDLGTVCSVLWPLLPACFPCRPSVPPTPARSRRNHS